MEKIKVLMIDDNISLVEMVKEYFNQNKNIEISLTAHDGQEGIEVLEKNQGNYDVVLLDLIMPKKDGLYVLQEIKKRKIECNVIVETSYNSQDVIREVSEHNVNYFILKPFELEDLENRIIDVKWYEEAKENYNVTLEVLANDRKGLLVDILNTVKETKANLMGVSTKTTKERIAIMDIDLEVENIEELNKVIRNIKKVDSVYEVRR